MTMPVADRVTVAGVVVTVCEAAGMTARHINATRVERIFFMIETNKYV